MRCLSVLYCDFGDGVLWFVKVLIIQYVLFYLFTIIHTYNKFLASSALLGTSLLLSILIANISSEFQAISVPLFSLGVFMSLYKGTKKQLCYYALYVGLITVLWFILFDTNIAFHFVINMLILTSIVVVLTIKHVEIKIPAILGVISFDIYLIHNKVILGLKDNIEFIPLWLFIITTVVATYLFFSFRTKILKI